MAAGAEHAAEDASLQPSGRFSRLSTGFKLFLILSLALLPLGLIAFFATLQSSRLADLEHRAQVRIALTESTRKIAATIAGDAATLRVAMKSFADRPDDLTICPRITEIIAAQGGLPTPFEIFGPASEPLCVAGGIAIPRPSTIALDNPGDDRISLDGDGLTVTVFSNTSSIVSVLRYPRSLLASLATPDGFDVDHSFTFQYDGDVLPIVDRRTGGGMAGSDTLTAPVGKTGITAEINVSRQAFTAAEQLAIFLPLIMWAAAATIGWAVVGRLLIRPLRQLERDVSAYTPGAVIRPFEKMTTPAFELRQLADTFQKITEKISTHEIELADGLARQTTLTREVHHRVKNNLQVVASLINLHSRGAKNADVIHAYASIQRRVDALAVVHRNHFAELEENRGVALRPLIGELGQSLRSSVAEGAPVPAVALEVQPVYVSQDVAVPVSFLLTELFELAICAVPGARIAISLHTLGEGKARLSVNSPGLTESAALTEGLEGRYGRVLEGLSRQLRAPLEKNVEDGIFALDISIVGQDDMV